MSLKVVCWNANGLQTRRNELEHFLQENNVDIALISETHLTSYLSLPKFCNFAVFLANHPSGASRGGAATLVRKSIQHYDEGKYVTDSLQSAVITVKINN
jgi:exonuclease III